MQPHGTAGLPRPDLDKVTDLADEPQALTGFRVRGGWKATEEGVGAPPKGTSNGSW